jgi:biopolymer transport protein ExbD
MARPAGEINAGSMADIAFLLLIFFLVTTTMDIDAGLARRLPPMPPEDSQQDTDVKINRRNVLTVDVNQSDNLLVGGEQIDVSMLKEKVLDFIVNPDKSEKVDSTFQGRPFRVSKGVVSLNNHRSTSYDMYIKVQNELVKAFNELRDEFAVREFGRKYASLPEEEQEIVRKAYPQNISEAEPLDTGKNRKR